MRCIVCFELVCGASLPSCCSVCCQDSIEEGLFDKTQFFVVLGNIPSGSIVCCTCREIHTCKMENPKTKHQLTSWKMKRQACSVPLWSRPNETNLVLHPESLVGTQGNQVCRQEVLLSIGVSVARNGFLLHTMLSPISRLFDSEYPHQKTLNFEKS